MATKDQLRKAFGSAWHVNAEAVYDLLASDGSGVGDGAVANLTVSGNATVGGTLGVTGNVTVTTLAGNVTGATGNLTSTVNAQGGFLIGNGTGYGNLSTGTVIDVTTGNLTFRGGLLVAAAA